MTQSLIPNTKTNNNRNDWGVGVVGDLFLFLRSRSWLILHMLILLPVVCHIYESTCNNLMIKNMKYLDKTL